MANWLKRVYIWLCKAKYLWLALSVLLFFLLFGFFGFYPESNESRIRMMGLILQLFGIFTVFKGILELRKLFNHPSLRTIGIKWLKSFPPYRIPKPITATLNVASTSMRAYISGITLPHRAGPNATIEERLSALESIFASIEHQTTEHEQQISQLNKAVNEGLSSERQKRERNILELEIKLETIETAGEYLSLIGLVWLFIGLVMSTASVELSHLFMN
jgi:hypothetical protein